jgi:hypothetical protein
LSFKNLKPISNTLPNVSKFLKGPITPVKHMETCFTTFKTNSHPIKEYAQSSDSLFFPQNTVKLQTKHEKHFKPEYNGMEIPDFLLDNNLEPLFL